MSATIITNFSGAFEYEPEIISDNARDGISAFQFRIVGGLTALNSAFQVDEDIVGVPDQPPGTFRVVRRNLEHIAGDPQTGLYRLSVSGEGGTGDNNLFISETSYAMQNQQVQGVVNLPLAQVPIQYNLIWLYPSATITTNSRDASPANAEAQAREIVGNLTISIVKDRPFNADGPVLVGNSQLETIYITASSVEKAGGLYRVRATASKGLIIN
jgi:hypothetical protein